MDSQLEWTQKLSDAFLAQQKDTKDTNQHVRAKAPLPSEAYWYCCPGVAAYYPAVLTCPEPWIKVPPDPVSTEKPGFLRQRSTSDRASRSHHVREHRMVGGAPRNSKRTTTRSGGSASTSTRRWMSHMSSPASRSSRPIWARAHH
jgi:hypothetical protein